MTLSRTARFLIAALLVAAAAFVWVNYFSQDPLAPSPVATDSGSAVTLADTQDGVDSTPATSTAGDQAGAADPSAATAAGSDAAGSDASGADASGADAAGAVAAGSDSAAASTTDAAPADGAADTAATPGADAPVVVTETGDTPAVVVTDGPTVVTRDLVVDVLPFLVTSPPQPGVDPEDAAANGASRPQVTQRTSINPFSPVVVQAPPAAPSGNVVAEPTPAPADTPVIEVVDVPVGAPGAPATPTSASGAAPSAPEATVAAPAPRALTPSSTLASNLPRALPSGMLPTTPEILRDTRSQAALTTPVVPDLASIAALMEPPTESQVELQAVGAGIPSDDVVTPEIIGVPQPRESAAATGPSLPLAVGADPLSRYLRDNDVRFTGTVLGPLSVGVFRSSLYAAPVVLTLGQPLPETDIILSDLRGYEARFLLGDRTQTLSLDLRR